MKKTLLWLLMLMCCCLMSGCAHDPIASMASKLPQNASPLPDARPQSALPDGEETVTLWFRYGTEPLLAQEARQIRLSPTRSFEQTLLEALLAGPSAGGAELTSLFPEGTQVLSTHRQGRTLFVTLSRQIMNPLADEPAAWRAQESWAQEVPLRRRLAMQSIAATVTDNLPVDQVVILTEPDAPGSSLRLRATYYQTGAARDALADPLTRDESLLLSPAACMEAILSSWQTRSWQRLARYTDHGLRGDEEAFLRRAEQLPLLTGYTFAGGNVSPDGRTAVFTVNAVTLTDGQPVRSDGWTFRLVRNGSVWKIPLDELTAGREGAP